MSSLSSAARDGIRQGRPFSPHRIGVVLSSSSPGISILRPILRLKSRRRPRFVNLAIRIQPVIATVDAFLNADLGNVKVAHF